MKLKTPAELKLEKTDEVIGFLGQTKLIRRHNGLHELSGGSYESQAIAFAWCRRFAPEIRFATPGKIIIRRRLSSTRVAGSKSRVCYRTGVGSSARQCLFLEARFRQ